MALEDFTTYTEIDEDNDMTVIANRITVDTMRRDALSYVRKDRGAGHFGDFEHLVHIYTSFCQQLGCYAYWGITNISNTITQMATNSEGIAVFGQETAGGDYFIYLRDRELVNTDSYDALVDTDYYLTIERAGAAGTCKIYTDAARTVLVDTLTIITGITTYRYIFGLMSLEQVTSVDRQKSGTVEDLDLQEPEPPPPPTDLTENQFVITGETSQVTLTKPGGGLIDYKITKDIDRKSFWSGNYAINDKGINAQPVVLRGVEYTDTVNTAFTDIFTNIIDMSNNNEEVTIYGFGDCLDGVYIIRNFGYGTIPGAVTAYAWSMTLEKVRGI